LEYSFVVLFRKIDLRFKRGQQMFEKDGSSNHSGDSVDKSRSKEDDELETVDSKQREEEKDDDRDKFRLNRVSYAVGECHLRMSLFKKHFDGACSPKKDNSMQSNKSFNSTETVVSYPFKMSVKLLKKLLKRMQYFIIENCQEPL
jgi:hypothetical protein